MGQLLLEHSLISSDSLQWAQSVASEKGVGLERALLDTGLISESVLTSYLTLEFNLPVIDIARFPSEPSALEAVSKGAALAYKALPLSISDGCLVVATGSPALDRLKGLERLTGLKVKEVVSLHGSIYEETLRRYRNGTSTEPQPSADDVIQGVNPEESLTGTNDLVISEASRPNTGTRSRSAARKAKSKRIRRSANKKIASAGAASPKVSTDVIQLETEGAEGFIEQPGQEEEISVPVDGTHSEPSPSLRDSSEETSTPTEDYVAEDDSPKADADEVEDSPGEFAPQETRELPMIVPMITLEDYSSDGGSEGWQGMQPTPGVGETLPAVAPQVLQIDKLVIEAKNLQQNLNANTIQQQLNAGSVQQQIITDTLHQQVNVYKVEQSLDGYGIDQEITLAPELGPEPGKEKEEKKSPAQTGLLMHPGDNSIRETVTSPDLSGKFMQANLRGRPQGTSLKVRSRWVPEAGEASLIIRAVEKIIEAAITEGASDIHIEPQEEELVIRFRIDGILRQAQILTVGMHQNMVSRIKVMANMDISEHRAPQDGQFTYSFQGHEVDFRVASIDTNHGEMVVMRLLDKSVSFLHLSELSMQPDILELYCSILEAPYGMVLASGPTGSGKTTSLYASLGHFDPKDTKIMTVEDPIEYKVPGISQIQVNRQAGMTFSTGLRGILRLDPDVILVGEVRDAETAEISVQAALTGHMVLSSIHANDAAGALLRLVDLGVEPFLVNSAVMCSIAQRLVRKPCVHCKRPVSRPEPEIRLMAKELGEERREFEYGAGCDACGHTGYLGRVPVFEMLLMTDAVRELVMKRAPASEIRLQAITEGMTSMTKDAALKVRDNLTTPSEIIRKVSTRV